MQRGFEGKIDPIEVAIRHVLQMGAETGRQNR